MNAAPHFTFGTLLQQFFVDRLIQQRHASTRTVEAYRDGFRLLFAFAEQRLKKRPADRRKTISRTRQTPHFTIF
jgi:hypothetical protein